MRFVGKPERVTASSTSETVRSNAACVVAAGTENKAVFVRRSTSMKWTLGTLRIAEMTLLRQDSQPIVGTLSITVRVAPVPPKRKQKTNIARVQPASQPASSVPIEMKKIQQQRPVEERKVGQNPRARLLGS